jgi:hypothetical protein
MSAEDVDELVIDPMVTRLPPPRHVRDNDAAVEELLDSYRHALCRFNRPTLEEGWRIASARLTVWTWPTPGEVAEACKEALREAAREGDADAWVQHATDLSDQDVRRFMTTSAHAARAREGGYEDKLKQYVRECAWVQAQYICGQEGVGYDHRTIFGTGPRDREAEQEWFTRQSEQAEKGSIQVRVPPRHTEGWRARPQPEGRGR